MLEDKMQMKEGNTIFFKSDQWQVSDNTLTVCDL